MALEPKTFALALTDAEILELRTILAKAGHPLFHKFHIYPDTALRVKAFECVERLYASEDGELLADYVREGFGALRCLSNRALAAQIFGLISPKLANVFELTLGDDLPQAIKDAIKYLDGEG